jgi:hypothetical protein
VARTSQHQTLRALDRIRLTLVLSVARLSKSGESAEVQRAVDNVASRRESVSQNVGRAAVSVDVGAVGLGNTRGGRGALRGDLAEDAFEGGDGAGRGRLEVLLDLGGV